MSKLESKSSTLAIYDIDELSLLDVNSLIDKGKRFTLRSVVDKGFTGDQVEGMASDNNTFTQSGLGVQGDT